MTEWIKRNSHASGSRIYEKPILKFSRIGGRFMLGNGILNAIGATSNDGLMFGINKAEKCIKIKIDNEPDAFYFKPKEGAYRFTSKMLADYFFEIYKPQTAVSYYKLTDNGFVLMK